MSGVVRSERDGPIASIVFDHQARHNAMTLDMWHAVPRLCAELDQDPEVRVLVLRGAGRAAFVAGADISQFGDQRPGDTDGGNGGYDRATEAAFVAIAQVSKPVVASIQGYCIGGGLAMAAVADIRYASDDSTFGLPPARLGVGYSAAGIGTLVDLVGPAVTKELVFAAEWIDADTALRWGLVNRTVPASEFETFVDERVRVIASRAPLSQRAAKLAVADHLRPQEDRRPEEVASAIAACASSEDYQEGIRAFLEKRTPAFGGR